MAETLSEEARAKVNLSLHVTGQREDGYHLLQSLVAFPDISDKLRARRSDRLSLQINGPFSGDLEADPDNLILRAARLFGPGKGAEIALEKNLPVAAGIGGGSADAAATLRLLSRLWGAPMPDLSDIAALGADVTVCLAPGPTLMEGIGEQLTRQQAFPACGMVLVNPRVTLSTEIVFHALESRRNTQMEPLPHRFETAHEMAGWLSKQRNDLQHSAIGHAPVIASVLNALSRTDACLLARMSGSGATCFGLYPDEHAALGASRQIRSVNPGWWVAASAL